MKTFGCVDGCSSNSLRLRDYKLVGNSLNPFLCGAFKWDEGELKKWCSKTQSDKFFGEVWQRCPSFRQSNQLTNSCRVQLLHFLEILGKLKIKPRAAGREAGMLSTVLWDNLTCHYASFLLEINSSVTHFVSTNGKNSCDLNLALTADPFNYKCPIKISSIRTLDLP